jgi:hypothetical protein
MERLDSFYNTIKGTRLMFAAVIISIFTVLISTLLYMLMVPDFSIFRYYISHLGAPPEGADEGHLYLYMIIYTLGMGIVAVLRVFILVFFIRFFQLKNSPRKLTWALLATGLIPSVGFSIVIIEPFTVSLTIHMMGAFLLFFGTVISGTIFTVIEFKTEKIPKSLPYSVILNVIMYLIFATLLFGAKFGLVPAGIAYFWEWICFCTSLFWLLIHGIYFHYNS